MATRIGDRAASATPFLLLAPFLVAAGVASVMFGRSRGRRLGLHGALQRFGSSSKFRDALLGQTKRDVLHALGAPRAAADPHHPARAVHGPDDLFLRASDIWYYPAVESEQSAMAIHFDKGIASDVEFFQHRAMAKG